MRSVCYVNVPNARQLRYEAREKGGVARQLPGVMDARKPVAKDADKCCFRFLFKKPQVTFLQQRPSPGHDFADAFHKLLVMSILRNIFACHISGKRRP
jgi:hypothetical protein